MDIAALAVNLKQMQVHQNVGMRLMKMTTQTAEKNAVDVVKLLEQVANPHLGQNLDVKV